MLRYLFIMIVAFSFPSMANDMIIVNQIEFEQLNLTQKTSADLLKWQKSNPKQAPSTKDIKNEMNLSLVKTIILD